MSIAFTRLTHMMTRTRQDDPEAEDRGNEVVVRLARQSAPLVVVSLLTAGGIHFGPMGQDVTGGRQEIQSLMIELGKMRVEINHLDNRISDINARRTAQVGDLEKRVLACELDIARQGSPGKSGR